MSGSASLGLRSGSCGSLASAGGRKAGARGWGWRGEKERLQLLHRALRLVGRRRAGVLLLLAVASAAVFCSLLAVVKDDNTSIIIANNYEVPNAIQNSVYPSTTRPLMMSRDQYSASGVDKIELPNRLHLSFANFTHHPCEGFSVPPPLVDKKRTGPRPCPVCYVSIDQAFVLMPLQASPSPVLKKLNYVVEDSIPANFSNQGSVFGGHPSLEQRKESFDVNESMTVHCGFVRGKKPGQGTGFDINDDDLLKMEQCRELVVASAIFGNYDMIQHPRNVSEFSKANACFYMFVDEETNAYVKNSSSLYRDNKVGLWRLVVVRNLPYEDPRRTGKIPKLLLHRLFPNVRFSVWIDAKLQLVADPYLLLERFLWRKNATFAISRHYKRFDVFEEAEANKAAGKYDNASIDYQIEFYRNEGLTHYSPAKLPVTSDVPEGCVIIREHIPITNLFTCLWFNEVDRFTSRDQISFSTVRADKHLHDPERLLTWAERYRIALGLGSAILYLHTECDQCVVHGDIKTSNVMLDSSRDAKLGDFGLARLVPHGDEPQTTEVVAGTVRYMDPEFVASQKRGTESDIYSFGVVLLEIACGRRPASSGQRKEASMLLTRVRDMYDRNAILDAADGRLNGEFDERQMERVLVTGLWCAHRERCRRPSIAQAMSVLRSDGNTVLPVLPESHGCGLVFRSFEEQAYGDLSGESDGSMGSSAATAYDTPEDSSCPLGEDS